MPAPRQYIDLVPAGFWDSAASLVGHAHLTGAKVVVGASITAAGNTK